MKYVLYLAIAFAVFPWLILWRSGPTMSNTHLKVHSKPRNFRAAVKTPLDAGPVRHGLLGDFIGVKATLGLETVNVEVGIAEQPL